MAPFPSKLPFLPAGQGKAFWAFGERYTIKLAGEDTGGRYALVEVEARPHNGPPPHIHRREDESFYVLEGEFSFLYQEQTLSAGAGSFVHIPKGTLHTFNNVGAQPARVLVLVSPAGLEKFFEEMGVPVAEVPEPPPVDVEKLMRLAPNYGIEIKLP